MNETFTLFRVNTVTSLMDTSERVASGTNFGALLDYARLKIHRWYIVRRDKHGTEIIVAQDYATWIPA